MTANRSTSIARFMRLPRVADETWQGGLVRMPAWVEESDGALRRPWAAVWVSPDTGLVNVKLEEAHGAVDPTLALDALVELGLKFAHFRPAAMEVADGALGAEIAAALGDRELGITVLGQLDDVKDRLAEMAQGIDGPAGAPGALWARGVTVERMRAFAAAARAFHDAAPWRHLTDEDLIRVEAPSVTRGLRYVTVLGASGRTYGLAFFATENDFEAILAAADAAVGPRGHWSVLYGPVSDLPFDDVDLWEEHRLPVAAVSAYPVALWFGPDKQLRRPEALELAEIEALLLALAETSEPEIDRGRWSREVRTHDGPRTVSLAIPALLEPLDTPVPPRRGIPDRRVMERTLVEIERYVADAEFTSEAEMNAAIQERFRGPVDRIPSTATTPREMAQDLVYQAFEARGRRRITLARRALELFPDCADAYGVLAEAAPDRATACELYAQGVAAGERALGPETFTEEAGHFWGVLATRPYMRLRFGLAQSLEALGRHPEALEHYRALLRLNPNDNQGVRYSLLAGLLVEGRDDDAGALLDQFGDEAGALWSYGRALWVFRREGDSDAARARLRRALDANRHIPRYVTGDAVWPGTLPDSYAFGSEEEAVICVAEQGEAWQATPGAAAWLTAQARLERSPRRGGSRKRRRR